MVITREAAKLNSGDQLRGIGVAAIAMIAVIDETPMSFDEFIDWYPDSEHRASFQLA